jgi:hypothetical protein
MNNNKKCSEQMSKNKTIYKIYWDLNKIEVKDKLDKKSKEYMCI